MPLPDGRTHKSRCSSAVETIETSLKEEHPASNAKTICSGGKMDFWEVGLSVQKPQMPDWL